MIKNKLRFFIWLLLIFTLSSCSIYNKAKNYYNSIEKYYNESSYIGAVDVNSLIDTSFDNLQINSHIEGDICYINNKKIGDNIYNVDINMQNTIIKDDYIYCFGVYYQNLYKPSLFVFDYDFNVISILSFDFSVYGSSDIYNLYSFYDGIYLLLCNGETGSWLQKVNFENGSLEKAIYIGKDEGTSNLSHYNFLQYDISIYNLENSSYFIHKSFLYKLSNNIIYKCSDLSAYSIKNASEDDFAFYSIIEKEETICIVEVNKSDVTILKEYDKFKSNSASVGVGLSFYVNGFLMITIRYTHVSDDYLGFVLYNLESKKDYFVPSNDNMNYFIKVANDSIVYGKNHIDVDGQNYLDAYLIKID